MILRVDHAAAYMHTQLWLGGNCVAVDGVASSVQCGPPEQVEQPG